MKYFLLLAVVVVFVWHWRSNRRADIAQKQRKAQHSPVSSAQPVDMVRCAHCQLHLAAADTVAGGKGRYCSPEHRTLAEK